MYDSYDSTGASSGFTAVFQLLFLVGFVYLLYRLSKQSAKKRQDQEQAVALLQPPPVASVGNEAIADRVEALARSATDPREADTLFRAAASIARGKYVLLSKLALKRVPVAPEVGTIAQTTAAGQTVAAATQPALPTAPTEPLAERGMKAIQNINVLLYLGSFMIVIAAGTFVGSNYGSIDNLTKVLLLGTLSAIFYLTGLGLYSYTDKIKPAGVTFTAIGLLIAPLVGLSVQNLLYANKPSGGIWLVTTAVMLVMQLVAYVSLKKTYIAYFSALTTISLFQALTATVSAPVYWYGWSMMLTSLLYIVLARTVRDQELTTALDTSAQIFVPISVALSLIGWSTYGLWSVGVQLILTSVFYLICAALRNFEESDTEVIYLGLSAAIFPVGFSMVLASRNVENWLIGTVLLVIAGSYILAEKLAVEKKHKQIFGTLAVILALLAPGFGFESPAQIAYLATVATILTLGQYLVSKQRLAYQAFGLLFSVLPLLYMLFVIKPVWQIQHMAVFYAVWSFFFVLVGLWQLRKRDAALYRYQIGLAMLWLLYAVSACFSPSLHVWLAVVLLISSLTLLLIAMADLPQLILASAAALYLAVGFLGAAQKWPVNGIGLAHLGVAAIFYGLHRWYKDFLIRPRLLAGAYGFGLFLAYTTVLSESSITASLLGGLICVTLYATSFVEKEKRVPAAIALIASYGVVLHLGSQLKWYVAASLAIWGAALFVVGNLDDTDRGKTARWLGIAGLSFGFLNSFGAETSLEKWLGVLIGLAAAATIMIESYRENSRTGKYVASVFVWVSTMRFFALIPITYAQVYVQTTALYLAALAYRQYQRGDKPTTDMLTIGALLVATGPLGLSALGDTTGGYIIAILGLGTALVLAGMSWHYRLIRDWGIGVLIIIALYKTSSFIFQLPTWVWLGVIGLSALGGALFLLSRRPHDDTK